MRDGPINGGWVEAHVRHRSGPVLQPGDIVTVDTLSSLRRAAARALIEAAGAGLRVLPP